MPDRELVGLELRRQGKPRNTDFGIKSICHVGEVKLGHSRAPQGDCIDGERRGCRPEPRAQALSVRSGKRSPGRRPERMRTRACGFK